MMIVSELPPGLWGEALMHAVYLKNRTWTRALPNGATPFEVLNEERPLFKNVPIWGTNIWVHDRSSGKLSVRAKEACWVGFDTNSKGHCVYWPRKHNVTVERSVIFSKDKL